MTFIIIYAAYSISVLVLGYWLELTSLKPESAILQGSFDGVHWDTIGICQVENTKYVRVKIVPDCKPAKQ